jgi:hypothetical protein
MKESIAFLVSLGRHYLQQSIHLFITRCLIRNTPLVALSNHLQLLPLSHSGGDWGAVTQLFFDNLSTLLGALFAIQNMSVFDVPMEDIENVIWGKIMPGVGITLVLGNSYYSWLAIRLSNRWGRPYTAQPYGLNTPAAFAFVFNIMCT